MTETHDPWRGVKPVPLMLLSDLQSGMSEALVYHAAGVDAARAAVERQHAADRAEEVEKAVAAERSEIAFDIAENPHSTWTATLRAQVETLTADAKALDDELMTIAHSLGMTDMCEGQGPVRASAEEMVRYIKEQSASLAAVEGERDQLKAAILWALGLGATLPMEPKPLAGKYRRRYHWRGELAERAGIDVNTEAAALTSPTQETTK